MMKQDYKIGDKNIIIDPTLKDFGKEFFLTQTPNDLNLWAYSKHNDQGISGWANESSFTLVNNGTGFKSHMVLFGDEESFTTMCGITEDSSEAFWDKALLFDYMDNGHVNCKRCLKVFKQEYLRMKEVEKMFG